MLRDARRRCPAPGRRHDRRCGAVRRIVPGRTRCRVRLVRSGPLPGGSGRRGMSVATPFRVQPVDYPQAMAELHAIREAVFVREQHVPAELERDELDASSLHVVARTLSGEAVGTGRLVPPTAGKPAKIGRMAVLRDWRNRGIGAALLLTLLRQARQRGWYEIALNAQVGALEFYLQHDFVPRGPRFHEAGIEHQTMHRILAGPFAVATAGDAVATSTALVQAARRSLCLFLHQLDPGLLDAPPLLEALRRFATAGSGAQARILLQHATPPQRPQAPLIGLAQRMPSVFAFREVADVVDRDYPSA